MRGIGVTYANCSESHPMKRSSPRARKGTAKGERRSNATRTVIGRRAAIFRNGRNQAVRLPQDLKFPDKVKEVQVRKQGDSILLSPVKPDWASFFALDVQVPDDFLARRDDSAPQERCSVMCLSASQFDANSTAVGGSKGAIRVASGIGGKWAREAFCPRTWIPSRSCHASAGAVEPAIA